MPEVEERLVLKEACQEAGEERGLGANRMGEPQVQLEGPAPQPQGGCWEWLFDQRRARMSSLHEDGCTPAVADLV